MTKEFVTNVLEAYDSDSSNPSVKVTYEGYSEIPFWNDDLKVKAIIQLLSTIDYKNYHESNKENLIDEHYQSISESLKFAFGYDY